LQDEIIHLKNKNPNLVAFNWEHFESQLPLLISSSATTRDKLLNLAQQIGDLCFSPWVKAIPKEEAEAIVTKLDEVVDYHYLYHELPNDKIPGIDTVYQELQHLVKPPSASKRKKWPFF
ncbi:MAG: hypothetical protein AAFO69_19550, partial [Bacteroidota bacterium]